jgi:hypothetical protein
MIAVSSNRLERTREQRQGDMGQLTELKVEKDVIQATLYGMEHYQNRNTGAS